METKQAKTPVISNDTKILCFDLETNGLHGEAFAAGAIVMDAKGKIVDQFTARTKIVGEVDDWVQQNVIPAIENMPMTHGAAKDLREAFWRWYLQAELKSDYILVSNGYPVEYRFLIKCQEENLAERYWQHPFPILDLFSLLLQAGIDTSDKVRIKNELSKSATYLPHNPLDDAKVTALLAFEAFKQTGKIN
ncbi:MAG: hypothetical protein ACXWLH_03515 [Candidatus Saccharimonadales bacterium]